MSDDLDDVRALLPSVDLRVDEVLREGDTTTVLRVRAVDGDGEKRSLIVKRYHDGGQTGEGQRRETAALASVPGAVRVPAVVATGPDVLLLEDLGDGSSVADALLGDDAAAAGAAVLGWAEAVAELHGATRDSRAAFGSALARTGLTELAETWLPDRLDEAERLLDRHAGALEVAIPADALDEFTGLADRLSPDGTAALTPSDACPDNNVHLGERLVLVDFERAQWCHVAWDVAYLLVPWPTCWCAWLLPDHWRDAALDRYRTVASDALPAVADDAFVGDVNAAAVGWCMLSAAFTLDYVLDSDPDLDHRVDPARPSPQRRALMLHRLRLAATVDAGLPALAELAESLHDVLQHRWGDLPLDLAPAFR